MISITPLAPLAPYKDAEAASFKTVMLSISLGFKVASIPVPPAEVPKELTSLDETGIPSITYKGYVEALRDARPRTRKLTFDPACPDEEENDTPGITPSIICVMEVTGRFLSLSVFITEADPV